MVMTPRYDNDNNLPSFAIMVNAAPYDGLAAESALAFAASVLDSDYQLACVFFYHDGVLHVCEAAADIRQHSLQARWAELAQPLRAPLLLCQAAGERRGLTSLALPEGFEWGGLARFFAALNPHTRLLSFGRCSGR